MILCNHSKDNDKRKEEPIMTNEQIIFNAAISSGIFTKEEAIAILESGRRLPLHTYQEWRRLGYQVSRTSMPRWCSTSGALLPASPPRTSRKKPPASMLILRNPTFSPLRRSRKPPPSRSKHAKSSWPITACLPSSARPVQPLNS